MLLILTTSSAVNLLPKSKNSGVTLNQSFFSTSARSLCLCLMNSRVVLPLRDISLPQLQDQMESEESAQSETEQTNRNREYQDDHQDDRVGCIT